MNKIEQLKAEKDGLVVWDDLERFARDGWESISETDLERLKWVGIFHRKTTPGFFMMRVRVTHGFLSADQAETLSDVARQFGRSAVDLTTRQQIQLRWLTIEAIPEALRRMALVGLSPLQTGMDSIRNVVGCPIAGIDPREIIQTIPLSRSITRGFLRNSDYTNLPRKFNIALSGCDGDCCHSAAHDVGATPARGPDGALGFNISVGGALGGSDPRFAVPLNAWAPPGRIRDIVLAILDLFRDHGPRETRTRSRLKYLIDEWGIDRFRDELERRLGAPLAPAGVSLLARHGEDHLGIHEQAQPGRFYAGIYVSTGRIGSRLLKEAARLSREYGAGEVRLTTQQNLVIPHIPESRLADFQADPALSEMPLNPSAIRRGLVVCTGNDFCHFALIDTKGLAEELVGKLEAMEAWTQPHRIHISGCPHACGQHRMGDIGIQGARTKINGEVVPAADVFRRSGHQELYQLGQEVASRIPWSDLPELLVSIGREIDEARAQPVIQ